MSCVKISILSTICVISSINYYNFWKGIKNMDFAWMCPLDSSFEHLIYVNYTSNLFISGKIGKKRFFAGRIRVRQFLYETYIQGVFMGFQLLYVQSLPILHMRKSTTYFSTRCWIHVSIINFSSSSFLCFLVL